MSEPTRSGPPNWLQPLVAAVADVSPADFGRELLPNGGKARHSAVLVLFSGSSSADADVLLLRRASTLRSHAGQVAFPGGATDPEDGSAVQTALRESTEEVGLNTESVLVLGQLPQLYLSVSSFLVTPVLAYWTDPHPVGVLDVGEVAGVARIRLADLVEPANRFTVRHPSGLVGAGFAVDGLFIWGFTAGVLAGLLRLGGFDRPWDDTVVREVPA